jgi:predicted nucleic acid-binding protein
MKIIIDSNIIYSALLSKNNICQYVIFSEHFDFYSPNFMLTEIFKLKEEIKKRSELNEDELIAQFERILSKITFVKEEIISTSFYFDSFNLCKDLDEDDIPFVALTLFLNGLLLTGDKILYNGLKAKNFNVTSIRDLYESLGS